MALLEDTTNLLICGLFLFLLTLLCTVAFSAVTVQYALQYSCHYSYTHFLICSIIENLAQTFFVFGHFVNFEVSFRCKIRHENLIEIYTKALCMSKYVFVSVETTRLGQDKCIWSLPCNTTSITSIRECRKQELFSIYSLKNVTRQTWAT